MNRQQRIQFVHDMLTCGQWVEVDGEMVELKSARVTDTGLVLVLDNDQIVSLTVE